MNTKVTKIDPRGLMRCCIATIEDYVEEHPDENLKEGFTLDCKYETEGNKNIILKNGTWQWNNKPTAV